jgi:hypothetical protein
MPVIKLTDDDWLSGSIVGTIVGNDADFLPSKLTWNSDRDEVRTTGEVFHGTGRRRIENSYTLSELLDSIASTKAGRKALIAALARAIT